MRVFDELNMISDKEKILDISTFFDEMELSKEEKEKRKKFAEDFLNIALFIFALFAVMLEYQYMKVDFIVMQLQSRYLELAKKHGIVIDDSIRLYIEEFSQEIVDTTLRHIDEEYFLSSDRATLIAENESQSVMGYQQLSEAKGKGYTKKTWITEGDKKVRKTHREVDMQEIALDQYFLVGDSLMLFPHDNISEYGRFAEPKEIINCRCVVVYS